MENFIFCAVIVVDQLRANNYNPNAVPLTTELLVSGRNLHRIYTHKLVERKKEEFRNKTNQQLGSINNGNLASIQKKDLLERTIAELKKDSDEMTFEAEK